ncbi:MAG: hypothetical protein ACK486_17150, partial [Cyanobacteriota bacterium]
MSQLTIQLSDKADALIAQLQKEIFNRRRKKVSAAGVIETLVESGAKSQSDKRFATSWKNLVADIEKAAKVADAHGAKPANLSDEEWVLVLAHRTRSTKASTARPKAAKAPGTRAARVATKKSTSTKAASPKAASSKAAPAKAAAAKPSAKPSSQPTAPFAAQTVEREAAPAAVKPVRRRATRTAAASAAKATAASAKPKSRSARSAGGKASVAKTSVAKRMAKAVGRLSSAPAAAVPNEPGLGGVFGGTGNG